MSLSEQVRVPPPRCPYCHDEIPRGEEPVVCPACHALHHEACLREHGACASCSAHHPRFANANRPVQVRTQPATGMLEHRRQLFRIETGLPFGLIAAIATIATLVDQGPDFSIGIVVAFAAATGLALSFVRKANLGFVLGVPLFLLGVNLALLAGWLDSHVSSDHPEVVGIGTAIACLGVSVLALAFFAGRRSGADDPEPEEGTGTK